MHRTPPTSPPDTVTPVPEPGPETLWRGLVEQIPAVTYITTFAPAAAVRYVSPQIEALLGHPPPAFVADRDLFSRCIHPDDLARVRREQRRAIEARAALDIEFRVTRRDGALVHLWAREQLILDAQGRPTHTQGILMDVTPMRTMRDALDAERATARRYLEVAGAAIVVLDRAGRVELLNRSGYALAGKPDGSLAGADFLGAVLRGDELDSARRIFTAAMATGQMPPSTEWTVHRPDESRRTVAWTHRVMRDEHDEVIGTVSSGTDVTERRAAAAQIAHLANHDPVTDLPNRRLFGEHLELALARAARGGRAVALLYLDLDDFKLVNDSLGHSAGDRLLVEVARRLRCRVRDADVLARHGGDEFLVLLGDLDPASAADAAQAAGRGILDALAVPFLVADMELHVTASVGISLLPADAFDGESLLRHADAAMYQAKRDGHDRVRVFDPVRSKPLHQLSLTSRLRHAIAEEQLVLHWQPIVDPVTGRLRALEALVRWQDPARGLVMPDAFVGLAEQAGIIDRLGELVLDLVVRQRVRWRDTDGFEPTVHVNLSPRELRNPRFADRVATRLGAHAIDPATVVLEITESAAMQDPATVRPLLRELRETGVRIAIDDFGAGHSSLSRLVGLPVDMLKIDRSFLTHATTDPASAAVMRAIVSLADALDLEAVAEGVETEAQREQLVALGCPLAQGFLLGRPGPARSVQAALQRSAGRPA